MKNILLKKYRMKHTSAGYEILYMERKWFVGSVSEAVYVKVDGHSIPGLTKRPKPEIGVQELNLRITAMI